MKKFFEKFRNTQTVAGARSCSASFGMTIKFAACTILTVILSVFTSCSQLNKGKTGTIIFGMGGGSVRSVTGQRTTLADALANFSQDKIDLDFAISGDCSAQQTVSFKTATNNGVKFENIPVGAVITCSCVVYIPESADAGRRDLYSGSEQITVQSGVNKVELVLKRVGSGSGTVIEDINSNEITNIYLDYDDFTLTAGESKDLFINVEPETVTDYTIEWSTSDENVATVKYGTVTAVGAGEAVITARVNDLRATCRVTVNPAVIPVESISLDKDELSMTVGQTENSYLTVSFTPENTTDKNITWTVKPEGIVSLEERYAGLLLFVTPLAQGTATITATAGGKSASCTVTVTEDTSPKTLTISGEADYIDEDKGEMVSEEYSISIEFNADDTWDDLEKRDERIFKQQSTLGPDGYIVKIYVDETHTINAEIKSSESSDQYKLVSINDKVSAYTADSYYLENFRNY